jgi:hypothetical protein
MSFPVRAQPFVTPMRRGRLPACSRRHTHVDGPQKTERPQRFPERDHPINHHVAGPAANPGSWTEVRLGARAHTNRTANRARASPPTRRSARHCQPRILRLTPVHCTSKEQPAGSPRLVTVAAPIRPYEQRATVGEGAPRVLHSLRSSRLDLRSCRSSKGGATACACTWRLTLLCESAHVSRRPASIRAACVRPPVLEQQLVDVASAQFARRALPAVQRAI